ncbi:MAG TPA: phosphotransferase [Streptosporangiaceae bacterium]|nr:phosphotransferase [Streptosporangiaceae bacterium]
MVSPAAARDFVARRYGDRAAGLRALGAGEWSHAYSLALDGREMVIRFGGYVEEFLKDQVMAAHASQALPIPTVTEVGQAGGGYFAVSERVSGGLLDQLDGQGMRAALPALLAALDAIGDIDVGGRGYGIWAPDLTAPAATWGQALLAVGDETPRVPGWRAALASSPTGSGPFERAYGRLAELAGDVRVPRRLIHGDMLNRNVLVRSDRITAVIDWGNAAFGDPLYDAAWLIYWWPWYPRWRAIDIESELREHWATRGGTPADAGRRLLACLLHIGLDAMSYTAFRGRHEDLARNAAQLAAL